MALSLKQKKIVWAASRRVLQLKKAAALARARSAKPTHKPTRKPVKACRPSARAGILDDEEGTVIDAEEVVNFAKAYQDLGRSVQEQLEDLLEMDPDRWDDINPNAVTLIERSLGGYLDEIDMAISDYRQWEAGELDDDFDSEEDFEEDLRRAARENLRGKRRL